MLNANVDVNLYTFSGRLNHSEGKTATQYKQELRHLQNDNMLQSEGPVALDVATVKIKIILSSDVPVRLVSENSQATTCEGLYCTSVETAG